MPQASDLDTRSRLITQLTSALSADPGVIAAWLAGSDSNRRTDQWSDIDLMLIVEDSHVEEAFAACRAAVTSVAPISLELRLPTPTWHQHDQVFWQLEGVPDWLMIDIVVMRRSSTAPRFLEPERHGTPQILFDRAGVVRAEPMDQTAHNARIRERIPALITRFHLLQHLVRKSVWRGDAPEAADRYMAYTLKPLVEMLRIKHCPDRFDYGMRYLKDDLPASAWEQVQALSTPGDLRKVLDAQQRAEALFRQVAASVSAERATAPPPARAR